MDDMNNNIPQSPIPPYQQPAYQQPYQAAPAAGSGKGLAIASLVLGIVALCLCCIWFLSIPAAIVGVILGVIALKKQTPGRGMAIAGLIMSIIGCVLAIIFIVIAIVAVNEATSSLYNWYNLFEDYGYYY